MAFSQGAILATTLILRRSWQDCKEHYADPIFKCAIFLCGGQPRDPLALLRNEFRVLDYATDGEVIHMPTANIWGASDPENPTYGLPLSRLCSARLRTSFIHSEGHEVPGSRNQDAMSGMLGCIRGTFERALARH